MFLISHVFHLLLSPTFFHIQTLRIQMSIHLPKLSIKPTFDWECCVFPIPPMILTGFWMQKYLNFRFDQRVNVYSVLSALLSSAYLFSFVVIYLPASTATINCLTFRCFCISFHSILTNIFTFDNSFYIDDWPVLNISAIANYNQLLSSVQETSIDLKLFRISFHI